MRRVHVDAIRATIAIAAPCVIKTPQGNILIDTPPELRLQLLRAKVRFVHAVLFTHYHADHLMGLDDLRPMPRYLGGPVPLYCTTEVERKIRTSVLLRLQPGRRVVADRLPAEAGVSHHRRRAVHGARRDA